MKKIISVVISPLFILIASASEIKIQKVVIKEKIKKEVPTKKEIDNEEIKITKQLDLGEILSELYPEIYHIRKGGIANDIVLRGFQRDNINVLIDGGKIYGACPNRMDPPSFLTILHSIEKVEIIEGAFDIENQGSLAGSINIITKEPKEGKGGEIDITVGSYTYINGSALAYVGNKTTKGLLGISKEYSKPYETGKGKKITEYPQGKAAYQDDKKDSTAFNISSLWGKLLITPLQNQKISFDFSYKDGKDVLYPYLLMDSLSDKNKRINFKYDIPEIKLDVQFYWNSNEHDMRDSYRVSAIPWTDGTKSNRGYMMRTYAESSIYGFKVNRGFELWDMNLKFGLDWYKRNWKADNTLMMLDNKGMIPDVDISNIGFYVKGVKKINHFIVSGGARYDLAKSKINENAFGTANTGIYSQYYNTYETSKNNNNFSGNIIIKYKFNKFSNIYIGYGRTVRIPDPQERYIALKKPNLPTPKPDWVGNPNLKPVKNKEIDFGGEWKKGIFKVKGNIFYSKIENYIYLVKIRNLANTKDAMSYTNINAKMYGGDISLTALLTDTISFDIGAAYQRCQKEDSSFSDKDLPEIPPLKIRTALFYDNLKYYGGIEIIYSAKQSNVDSLLNEQETASYTVVNLKAGANYEKFSFNFGIDNIFNKNYYTHLSYLRNPFSIGTKIPESGRFIYGRISYNFM